MDFKKLFSIALLLFFSCTLLTVACKKDSNTDTCVTANMSYASDIKPILKDNGCTASACHGGSVPTTFDFSDYAGLKLAVDAKRLVGAIKRETGFNPMPKGADKISECNIAKVEAWVAQGALDN